MQGGKVWYAILYLIVLILLFKFFPKAAYALGAITLLVLLLRLRK